MDAGSHDGNIRNRYVWNVLGCKAVEEEALEQEIRIAAAGASGEWITLAVVIKTQGRRGEVAVELHTDVPDRFRQEMRLWALGKDGQRREVTVEDLWPHKSFLC